MHASTLFATVVLLSAALINAYDPVKMLCLVNQQRASNGLNPLGLSQQLENAAQQHSDDQARMRSMTHDGSDGSSPGDRVERAGYNWRSVAENVAYGYGDEEECMKEWMNSPGHRENILGRDYTHFGSAVGYAGSTPYYTQDFGGDGQSHNFPECPSGGSYGDSGGANDYADSGSNSDYSGGGGSSPSSNYGGSDGGNMDYSGGGHSPSGGSKYPSGGRSPSSGSKYPSGGQSPSTNYGGSAPSSGHRHKSGRRHKRTHKNNSYGGDVNDSNDAKKKKKKTVKTYSSTPKYGGQKDSHNHRGKSYGNKAPSRGYGGNKGSKGSKGAYGSKVSYGSKGGNTQHKAY
jgi:hypothetical protein